MIFITILMQLFVAKCLWLNCAPKREFTVFDLNIPNTLFPPGSPPSTLLPDRGTIEAVQEARDVTLWETNGEAVYLVKKFATLDQSKDWFRDNENIYSYTEVLQTSSQVNIILTHKPLYADDFSILCGYLINHLNCSFQARYEEFYILFRSSISDDMTAGDYLEVLEYLDSRMADLLKKPPARTGYEKAYEISGLAR